MNKEEIEKILIRKEISSCRELSKELIGRRRNIILFNERFRIDFENKMSSIYELIEENQQLKEEINQLENKYNKALELLVDFNLPCEQQMFMDRYSEWCELNCSVDDECYKKCWNKYIEAELEKSKS